VPAWREVGCLYFAAERAPIAEPLLVLDGDADGPVNNLCVPSAVAPGYAPAGAALISATVLGGALAATDAELESAVRAQMSRWFGSQVASWRHLRTLRIAHALPDQRPPALAAWRRPVRHPSGVFVCGDHIDNASINGALESGRRAAEAVIADLSTRGGSPGRRWSPDQLP
jgi:phytoene dehydrogenase-like protein